LHVTDPHLFADAEGSLRGTVTRKSLIAVLDDIDRRGWPADLIAMTGDLIQDDSAEAYDRFVEIMSPLGLPILCIPGNHDVRLLMQAKLADKPFSYCGSLQIGDWLVTGIDSCLDGGAGGQVSADELERLDNQLRSTSAAHVAVLLHHPPLPMRSKWLDTVGLHNGVEFLDTIAAAGNVRTAIFGHVHQQFDEMHGPIRIIGTPSTCAQFKPGSDDFELDDKPPAYRRIKLRVDGTVDSELMWLETDQYDYA
jgi:Icc protein